MTPDYLGRLFQQRSLTRLIRFDEQAVPRSTPADLTEALWKRFAFRSREPAESHLLKRGILTRDVDGTVRPSVAGILLCSDRPDRYFPNAFIEAVRYKGTEQDSGRQLDARKLAGPLDAQITQAMEFLERNQSIMAVKIPHRVEIPQFSGRAVFEAVVNAVAHRDYAVYGSKVRFFMFDDRLEIYSPGPLPNTVTIDSLPLRQVTRNELVTSLLAETPIAETVGDVGRGYFMEKRGDGVPIILAESERLSGKKPVYRLIDDAELMLTVWSALPPA
jgi:ATP-dependent DNA helicase RecG